MQEPLPPLFAQIPEELAPWFDPAAPWQLLGEPLDAFFAAQGEDRFESPLPPDAHLLGTGFWIGAGVRIGPGATLEGPLRIGQDAEIRPGSYLRGGCWLGDGTVVGASSELKRAVLFDRARAPHLNYIGDSILGCEVNLGAGTILSNFRHDGGEIRVPVQGSRRLATGRQKLSAILGDGVLTGCNAVLHPGTIVGSGTQIYPGVQLRPGIYPADAIIKLRQEIEVVLRRDQGPHAP